jgi:GT2 family glycosyltransferase
MSDRPKIFIVTLNWNNYKDTSQCLSSLRGIDYPNHQVVLVDNASSDGSVGKIGGSFPEITLIKNANNLGFAEGNNVGIRYALDQGAEYVLLLNNDTIVRPDFLSKLLQPALADPNIGVLGPKIYLDNSSVIWFAGGKLNKATGVTFHVGEGQFDRGQLNDPLDMDFASGCAMLIKCDVFEKCGLLDKDYYHSYEDADFCIRAKGTGIKIEYVPQSIVYHKLARSSGGRRSAFYLYYRTRNHLLFKQKRKIETLFFWPVFVFLVLRRVFGALIIGRPSGAWATILGICDYYTGRWGKGSGDRFR